MGQLDRRAHVRGLSGTEPTRPRLIAMILGTFSEMPGLRLHLGQASRLFGLRLSTCEAVLRDLVYDGKLGRTSDGQYVNGQFNGVQIEPVSRHGAETTRRGR